MKTKKTEKTELTGLDRMQAALRVVEDVMRAEGVVPNKHQRLLMRFGGELGEFMFGHLARQTEALEAIAAALSRKPKGK